MSIATEPDEVQAIAKAPSDPMLTLCRCVDFISGETTHTFMANPAKQEECFARARRAVGHRPGHWDIQWRDDAAQSSWSRAGLSFTVANGRSPASVVEAAPTRQPKTCSHCETRERYDRSTCEAAAKLKHAGLAYLATDIDWSEVLTRYGRVEAAELVRDLASTADEYEVAEIVKQFYAPPEPEGE